MDSGSINKGISSLLFDITDNKAVAPLFVPLRHAAIDRSSHKARKVARKVFINTLNYLHFTGEHVILLMSRTSTGQDYIMRVFPSPCMEDKVTVSIQSDSPVDLEGFQLRSLIIDDGQSVMIIQVEPDGSTEKTITLKLAVQGVVSKERQARRFQCSLVDAHLRQETFQMAGQLEDFTSTSLRIRLNNGVGMGKYGFSLNREIHVTLYSREKAVYSGDCIFIRKEDDSGTIILKPTRTQYPRFKERKLRNPRLNLVPTPKVSFVHPFSNRNVSFEVTDLTNSGFSVLELDDSGRLVPGMIVPEVTLIFSGGLKLKCSAQVVHAQRQKRSMQKYGFAIYDMDLVSYNQFFNIYSSSIDRHANVTREVDMEALWVFFFKSGFIYPKKYENLCGYKEDFKGTYDKLYHNSPEIFANFTYQNNGDIYGHVSLIKAYERTWMIHHLAAKPMGKKRVGLHVLNHIMYYFDGFCRLPSIGMDYMIFYFRPENRFPDYFFGGFYREFNNPKGCSMDCFAYLNCSALTQRGSLPERWSLQKCTGKDIVNLRSWYNSRSGGLMIDSFCLDADQGSITINDLYAGSGLKRNYQAFALKHDGIAKAYIIADESDMGVNLSEFLNSLKVIVTDSELPWSILYSSLGIFIDIYGKTMIPLLVYPHTYMEEHSVGYDHKYNLWILNARSGDEYTESLKRMAKIRLWKLFVHYLKNKIRRK